MSAVRYRFPAERRGRWKPVVALALLAGLAWQATAFGVVALIIGIPAGIVVGRWAWSTLADDVGTVAEPIVPVLAVVLGVPLVLLVADLVAAFPSRRAGRTRSAVVLRSE